MTVSLADNALTLLGTVKEDLGITDATRDQQLKRLINAASDAIEHHCNRKFWRDTAIEEKVRGYGGTEMRLARPPINSIASVVYDGTTVDADDYEIIGDGSEGIVFKVNGWLWTAHSMGDITRGIVPGTERPLYTVTYDGGWYTPKQEDDGAGTRGLPWDLEDAVIDLVRTYYISKRRDPSISSEKLLSWSASYGGAAGGGIGGGVLPPSIAAKVERYRLVDRP